jgi:hypothetical protein
MLEFLDFFNSYRVIIQHLASLLLAAAIWRWGGGPERWLIVIFLVSMVLPVYPMGWLSKGSGSVQAYMQAWFVIDVIATGLFIAIALNANRNYPLWVAGFQVVALVAHAVEAMVDAVSPLASAVLMVGPSYGILLVLIGGFVRHLIRLRRFGPYRDWRMSPPSLMWLRL